MFDFLGSDNYDSSSSPLSQLIQAGAGIGETALLASQAPQAIAPASFIPGAGNALPGIVSTQTHSNMLLWLAALVIGVFAIIKLA